MKLRKYRWDILIILLCAAAGAVIALVLFAGSASGRTVQVRVDGKIAAEFPLDEDRTFEIKSPGGGSNLLVISRGEAWISEASCPDRLCMGMGRISKAGQAVICLPNKVVVEVTEKSRGADPGSDPEPRPETDPGSDPGADPGVDIIAG